MNDPAHNKRSMQFVKEFVAVMQRRGHSLEEVFQMLREAEDVIDAEEDAREDYDDFLEFGHGRRSGEDFHSDG